VFCGKGLLLRSSILFLLRKRSNLELLVIDDGSTDRTGEVIKSYDDPRLTYIYQDNQDAYNTINRGLHMAKGDYIAILNSDDIYVPNRLERLLNILKKTKAACIFTDIQPIDEKGEEILDAGHWWHIWHKKNRDFYKECGDIYTGFLKGNFMVTTSNLFFRRVRIMLNFPGQVTYLDDEKLLYYRVHGGSTLSEAAIVGREQDKSVIRKYMLEKVPDDLKSIVTTGVDRLVELENELFAVRAEMEKNAR